MRPLTLAAAVAAVLVVPFGLQARHALSTQSAPAMRGRIGDARVGFLTTSKDSTPNKSAAILRWRLEKAQPGEASSDPTQRIVYYIDPGMPAEWVPFVKAGVEEWNRAFEAAGFTRAIEARSGSPGASGRHATIGWTSDPGDSITTTRTVNRATGEIRQASIRISSSYIKRLRAAYGPLLAAADARLIQSIESPATLGPLLRAAVAHEVGHTLGLANNLIAHFPSDSARTSGWVKRMGPVATVMNPGLLNPWARGGGDIAVADFVARVGPYDVAAIRWGYTPIAAGDERATLDRWAAEGTNQRWLRWTPAARSYAAFGPASIAVSATDPIERAKMFERTMFDAIPLLRTFPMEEGDDTRPYRNAYTLLLHQWEGTIRDIVALVAGKELRANGVWVPIPEARQRAAVQYLGAHVFHRPEYLLDSAAAERWLPQDTATLQMPMNRLRTIIGRQQSTLLGELLSAEKLTRLWKDQGTGGYSLVEMLTDVRTAVWGDVLNPVKRDSMRLSRDVRELHFEYLAVMGAHINSPPAPPRPADPLWATFWRTPAPQPPAPLVRRVRSDLVRLGILLDSAITQNPSNETKKHLEEMRSQLRQILDPRKG